MYLSAFKHGITNNGFAGPKSSLISELSSRLSQLIIVVYTEQIVVYTEQISKNLVKTSVINTWLCVFLDLLCAWIHLS